MDEKPEPPITLIVKRGALRRFHKLQKDTAHLPVVVAWDRRTGESQEDETSAEDRRKNPSFTWEMADFAVVPGQEGLDGAEDDESEK